MEEQNLELGLIGNGSVAALIDKSASIVWACLPRFDSDPVFCSLLMGGEREKFGHFSVKLENQTYAEQTYIRNTAIIKTTLHAEDGSAVEITDFAPRYSHYGRTFHPLLIIRRLRCLKGMPRITVLFRPATETGRVGAKKILGSNHIRFDGGGQELRLTTDGPASLIYREIPFILQKEMSLILSPDEPLQETPSQASLSLFEQTKKYWQEWVRHLAMPAEWQEVVLRSAITLKLCCYEETGGIVAALTTSIPEYEGTGRTWDYRYCWLRDAFFVVQALNRLGATETMERYMGYIKNIVTIADKERIQPLYGISFEKEIPESIAEHLCGYRDNKPVRFGNAAFSQVQNDSYGSVILALAQIFFDERLNQEGNAALFELLERLGESALRVWYEEDAGLWEYRTRTAVHTHSAAMCWAACDRLSKIAAKIGSDNKSIFWRESADRMRERILTEAWNDKKGCFVSSFGGEYVDASLLLLPEIGLVESSDPRFVSTLSVIETELKVGNVIFRYRNNDDFGIQETSFNICSLWYAQALKRAGRDKEARAVFEGILKRRNSLGLLSEGSHPETGEMWGNFPQTYSMVGLIQTALMLSEPWERIL